MLFRSQIEQHLAVPATWSFTSFTLEIHGMFHGLIMIKLVHDITGKASCFPIFFAIRAMLLIPIAYSSAVDKDKPS